MNYFFTITSNFLSCKLTVPKFQNRGLHNKSLKIFSIKISNSKFLAQQENCYQDENFFYINKSTNQDNSIYFLSNEDLNNKYLETLNLKNDFLSTLPAYRCNLRIQNLSGSFSSYQSEYPGRMVDKKGSILSQVSSLFNDDKDSKNILIFPNIYFEPKKIPFKVYILDIVEKKILLEKEFYTNTLNFWDINSEYINENNFFYTSGYLGIPIYYNEKDKMISLEHTHPLQTYILSENKYKIIKELKENVQRIVVK
jgi:hypothetical protein